MNPFSDEENSPIYIRTQSDREGTCENKFKGFKKYLNNLELTRGLPDGHLYNDCMSTVNNTKQPNAATKFQFGFFYKTGQPRFSIFIKKSPIFYRPTRGDLFKAQLIQSQNRTFANLGHGLKKILSGPYTRRRRIFSQKRKG